MSNIDRLEARNVRLEAIPIGELFRDACEREVANPAIQECMDLHGLDDLDINDMEIDPTNPGGRCVRDALEATRHGELLQQVNQCISQKVRELFEATFEDLPFDGISETSLLRATLPPIEQCFDQCIDKARAHCAAKGLTPEEDGEAYWQCFADFNRECGRACRDDHPGPIR